MSMKIKGDALVGLIMMFVIFVSIIASIILWNGGYLLVGLLLGGGLGMIWMGIMGVLNKSVLVEGADPDTGRFEDDGQEVVGSKAVVWSILFIIVGIFLLILAPVFLFLYIL